MLYRKDNRTAEKFQKDIKNSHITEAAIALRLALFHYNLTKTWPDITPSPSFTGDLLEDKDVSSDADFQIGKVKLEITRSNRELDRVFHEKIGKSDRCANGDFSIVFVNGIKDIREPNFIIISPDDMTKLIKKSLKKYGIAKMPSNGVGALLKQAYRFDISWFDGLWNVLPELKRKLPAKYNNIIEVANAN